MNAIVVGQLGFLILNSIPLGQLGEATCPFPESTKKWTNRAVYEAANAGHPYYTMAKLGDGYNRTLNLDGFCNDILWTSDQFVLLNKTTSEWHASVKSPMGVFLKFDNADCPLKGVTVARTAPGSPYEAELRMQFFPCNPAYGSTPPPASAASIAIGLQPGGAFAGIGEGPNLLNWMNEVSGVKSTKTLPSTISMKQKIEIKQVGDAIHGSAACDADILEWVDFASSMAGCKAACSAAYSKANATGELNKRCTGFSYNPHNPSAKQCVLHKSAVDVIVSKGRRLGGHGKDEDKTTTSTTTTIDMFGSAGWVCYKMSFTSAVPEKITSTTPAPVYHQPLHIKEVMGGAKQSMQEAILHQVEPPTPYCFQTTWWFMLQDVLGKPAHISLQQDHWDKIMKLVPEYASDTTAVNSTVTIDRVLVKTCSNVTGWGRTCTMPKSRETCDTAQVINGVVTGCTTPILSWLLVYLAYKQLKSPDSSQIIVGSQDEIKAPTCNVMVVVVCSMLSLVTALCISYGVSTFIQKILSPNCLHGHREQMVVFLACGGATALTMMIGMLYLFKSSKTQIKAEESKPKPKLALAEVLPDGSHVFHNHDIMNSGPMLPSHGQQMEIKHDAVSSFRSV